MPKESITRTKPRAIASRRCVENRHHATSIAGRIGVPRVPSAAGLDGCVAEGAADFLYRTQRGHRSNHDVERRRLSDLRLMDEGTADPGGDLGCCAEQCL